MIALIAAVAEGGAIGYENKLLYWIPNDLKRFKALTTGHTIIMGRKTFESLPKGALPNRRNVVLSRKQTVFPGAETFASLEEALRSCPAEEEVFIIGGASLYHAALPLADKLYLTHIEATPPHADAFFPPVSSAEWEIVHEERHQPDEQQPLPYRFTDYIRREG
ncbi:MAG: dihydrofolate reductase [Bacteroidaceae bacterium]|nr:dihydrofolate reductase [Bacteroidaceae bacterium]